METKDLILDEAETLIEVEGIEGLTIRKVAERVNVSVSVVHHHFISKQGLLDACKKRYYANAAAVLAAGVQQSSGKPAGEMIEHLVRDLFRFARRNIGVLRLVTRDILASGRLIEPFRSFEQRPMHHLAAELIAPNLDMSLEVARIRLQAVAVLIARFAASTDDDLSGLLGYSGDPAVAAAEDQVVAMSKLILIGKLEP